MCIRDRNDVVATVPTIAVTFSGSTYSITVNGVLLGANPVLTLTKGQTYKFILNVVGHGFNLTTTSGGISNLYSTGLVGSNGTEVTNDSTRFIWTVPLNAPNILFYQDGVTLSNFGTINLIAGAIASTEKGANSGVATLDSSGKIPVAQLPRSVSLLTSAATSETLELSDNGCILEMTAGTAIAMTLPNNLPIGFNIIVVQKGDGQITFTPASGAVLRHPDGHAKSAKKYSSCTLYVSTNTGTNAEYILAGNTAS